MGAGTDDLSWRGQAHMADIVQRQRAIAQTRAAIAATLRAMRVQFTPGRLAEQEQVKAAVREVSALVVQVTKVQARDRVLDTAEQAKDAVLEATTGTINKVEQLVRGSDHPADEARAPAPGERQG